MGDRCILTLNPMLPDKKVAADIGKLRPYAIIAADEDWARGDIAAAAREVGAVGIDLGDGVRSAVSLATGLERLGPGPFADPLPGVAVLMLTSGTTGEPKRTPQTYRQLELNFRRSARADKSASEDAPPAIRDETVIVHGPFVHISGMYFILHAAVTGRAIYLLERFSLDEWRKAIAHVKPAVAGGPPAVMKMILDANIPAEEFASIRAFTCGTAPIAPEAIDEFVKRYGTPVLTTYGATEFAGAICGWSIATFQKYWSTKRGSAGRMHPGIEARTVDRETFAPLPAGEIGLLELRGPVLGDGVNWVRVSDLAKIDADHFLWVVGRADNAILRGGFKVLPDEVVKAIESHPAISEASVVGIADDRLGAVPVAAFVVKPDAPAPTVQELTAFLREQLTPYQIPAQFRQVAELPRTPSLKVSMPGVKALFVDQEVAG
jgi:acyl-CoA synthetase (AMP-forming)/AMP-acid ligase II